MGMKKYIEKRVPGYFKIQITSMVDMFVILLVFLLKSYSTSPVNINPSKDLTLPISSTVKDPEEVLKLVVSKKGILVEDKQVVEFTSGTLTAKDMDPTDPSFILALYKELDEKAKMTQDISGKNEELQFDGRILVQADKDLPYSTLQKVMYTSMLAGYPNVKLAVVADN